MFNFFKKKSENQEKPPSKSQIKLCKQLGLIITPEMSRKNVSELLGVSLQQEKYKKIYDEIHREENEAFEKEERETYGDTLVDELKKWEKYCDTYDQYYLVFKRGSNVIYEIVEFETAEIVGEKKYSIKISILLPKLHKEKDTGEYLEWEKEVNLKPNQVLKIEKLSEIIDMFDLEAYESTLMKYKEDEN